MSRSLPQQENTSQSLVQKGIILVNCIAPLPSSYIIINLNNNRISVFDTNGHFMYCFGKQGVGEGEINNPYFITVDLLGNLYVSDTWNNRLVILY